MKWKANTMAARARRSPTNFIRKTIAPKGRKGPPSLLRLRRVVLLHDQSETFVAGLFLFRREHHLDEEVIRRHPVRDDEQLRQRRGLGRVSLLLLQRVERREEVRQPRDLDAEAAALFLRRIHIAVAHRD